MNAYIYGTYAFKSKDGTARVHVPRNITAAELSRPLAVIGKEVKKCGRERSVVTSR